MPDTSLSRAQRYRLRHPDRVKASYSKWRQAHLEQERLRLRTWQSSHPEYYVQKRNDPAGRLSTNLRSRLNRAIRGSYKSGSAISDVGCTIPELKAYLESKFKPGMTWENYGRTGWHIDHIEPLAKFDLTDREQLLQACHYSNLQPLWAEENLMKGAQ
jgi:hypothetical protein